MKKFIQIPLMIFPMLVFSQVQEPVAPKKPKALTMHTHTRNDDYYWMNERDSKPVFEHLAKENAYNDEYFKPIHSRDKKIINGKIQLYLNLLDLDLCVLIAFFPIHFQI